MSDMQKSTPSGLEPDKRPLTQQESDLIRWLTEHSHRDASSLLTQICDLTVFEKCTCGCPTVYFALNGEAVSRKGERIVSDWIALVGIMDVSVTLWETNGKISSLEVTSGPGSETPFGLPSIESVKGH
jgi:hypothetical protein